MLLKKLTLLYLRSSFGRPRSNSKSRCWACRQRFQELRRLVICFQYSLWFLTRKQVWKKRRGGLWIEDQTELDSLLIPPKYKKYVRKFKEGGMDWYAERDLEEIWTQNSMNGCTNRASTVRVLVRGEHAVAFETALHFYWWEGFIYHLYDLGCLDHLDWIKPLTQMRLISWN